MRAQLGRLHRLITDLREVARAEEGAPGVREATLDVAELVDAAVRAAAPRYSAKGVTLNAVHPSTIPAIAGARFTIILPIGAGVDSGAL
jgi:signal transduction histidine kinase